MNVIISNKNESVLMSLGIDVIKTLNGELLVTIDEQVLELKELIRNKRFSKEFEEQPEVIKEKKKYIPPMSHPWKLKSFLKQMEQSHKQHQYA